MSPKAARCACFPSASASWLGPRSRYRCGRSGDVLGALSVGCASAGESGRAAGHSRFARRSESESCAGGHHRRPARAAGGNDLLMVDPLKVDRRGGHVGVPELALDDLERDALAGGLERVGVAELVRREPAPDPLASRRIRGLAAAGCGRARSAAGRPSITQNSDPAGSAARTVSHGRNCSQPVVDAESAAPARTCPRRGRPAPRIFDRE